MPRERAASLDGGTRAVTGATEESNNNSNSSNNNAQAQTDSFTPSRPNMPVTVSPQNDQQQQDNAYNMAPMSDALPSAHFRPAQYLLPPPHPPPHSHPGRRRFDHANHPAQVLQQLQHVSPYGPSPVVGVVHQGYYTQQQLQLQHQHQQSQQPQAQPSLQFSPFYGGGQIPPSSYSSMPPNQNMSFYPNQIIMSHHQQQQQPGYYYPSTPPYGLQAEALLPQAVPVRGGYISETSAAPSGSRFAPQTVGGGSDQYTGSQYSKGNVEEDRANVVRGPPRKPKQSGHAIWLGNLPPQTDLMALVQHVCKEAPGLQSLFLISKSNCAFANYKDEPTCIDAQKKLHDSKFQMGRLVSRLRKNTVEGVAGTAPTGPASPKTNVPQTAIEDSNSTDTGASSPAPGNGHQRQKRGKSLAEGSAAQQDKFFILKSLTVHDLNLSVASGIWATQQHNENALNAAFKNAENVYLIFSANKSGEYFGYARMTSEIDDDPASAVVFAPKTQPIDQVNLPKAIPTEPTQHAPKGRIIDDLIRGTIFWEIDRGDEDMATATADSEDGESDTGSAKNDDSGEDANKAWGKPFKLVWLSTSRLPFYRTRGLRNPWNSNREVKIARDGTEIEPTVGRKLISLFNRPNHHHQRPAGTSTAAPLGAPVQRVIPGFSQGRGYLQ